MTEEVQSRGTVLVIDDNVTNLKVASEHLKADGFQILTARDGESGIERVKLARPDLILLDVQMPGIDGFETCRRLKNDNLTKDIPVIFTTVLTTVEDKLKGFNAGAVDYIPKPFQIEELLARVRAHVRLYDLQRELQRKNAELQRLAVLDGLTQIANRRRFDQYLLEQWEAGIANTSPLSLILSDVDYFKRFNDSFGHQAGDRCLQRVAQALNRVAGYNKDLVARYGGEEFAIILPDTDTRGASRVAELVRNEIHNLKIPHSHPEPNSFVTISMGIATILPSDQKDLKTLLAAADAALYEAKRQGRDRAATNPDYII